MTAYCGRPYESILDRFRAAGIPGSPAPELAEAITPERLERGRYLAENVMACVGCHSQRDWTKFGGPIQPGSIGMGGELFDEAIGIPGRIHVRNITPAALGSWSDG